MAISHLLALPNREPVVLSMWCESSDSRYLYANDYTEMHYRCCRSGA
jgi:hypothetical protein